MQTQIGFRVEFYRQVDGPHGPEGYVGAALCEDAYTTAAVPSTGDLISVVTLQGGAQPRIPLEPQAGGPFMKVAAVEHYPVPATSGDDLPSWWEASYSKPGAQVIIHAQAPRSASDAVNLIRGFTLMGWQLHADTGSGTPLGEAMRARYDEGG